MLILTVLVILCRQYSAGLHGGDQAGSAHLRQLISRQGMFSQGVDPFLMEFSGLLGIVDLDLMISGGHNGLQILRTEHRSDAGSTCGAFSADHTGVQHLILSCRSDGDHTAFCPAALRFVHPFLEFLLCRTYAESFQFLCRVQSKLVIVDLQPAQLRTLSFQDQRVIPCLFQIVPEVSSAVGRCCQSRLRGQSRDIEPVGARCPDPRQRAGSDDDDILRSKGILRSVERIEHDLGAHGLSTDIEFPIPIGPGILLHFSGGKIHHHDLSHIAGIFRHVLSSPIESL